MQNPINPSLAGIVVACVALTPSLFAALPEVTPTAKPMEIQISSGTVEIEGKPVHVDPTTLTVAPPKSWKKSETFPTPDNYIPQWNNWMPWPGQGKNKEKPGAITFERRADENGVLMLGLPYNHYPTKELVVTSADGSTTFSEGTHYKLLKEYGQIGNLDGQMGEPMSGEVKVDYVEVYERLDLVQVSGSGKVSIKQGEPRITCASLPEADAGHTGLAGIFVNATLYGGIPLTAELIWPIEPQPPVAPIHPEATSKTLAKLQAGRDVSIAFMGDSLTLGAEAGQWWSDDTQHWRGRFVNTLEERFPGSKVNQVKAWQGGKGTEFGLQALKETVLPAKPDLLILMMGINDADSSTNGKPKVAPAVYAGHMENIIKKAQEAGIEVLLMTSMQPYPLKANGHAQRWPEYVEQQIKLAQKYQIGLANTYEEWLNLASHGIPPSSQLHNWNNHPGSFGHGVLASVPLRFFPKELPAGMTLPSVPTEHPHPVAEAAAQTRVVTMQETTNDGLTVIAPTQYVKDQEFEVTVKIAKDPSLPQKLAFSFNYMKTGGGFGGFLQFIPNPINVTDAGEFQTTLKITKSKPDLASVNLNIYLSPDGDWKNKTASASVNLLPVAATTAEP